MTPSIACPTQPVPAWAEHSSTEEIISWLLQRHHEPLRQELDRLKAMTLKVLFTHGAKDHELLEPLAQAFLDLREKLLPHLEKEEQVIFPWILSGRTVPRGGPIACMMQEHNQAMELLARIRELTGNFEAPANACGTWRALWNGLERLEQDLLEHMRVENEVLFPRAVAPRDVRREAATG